MKTIELTGVALDWAVAKCEGYTCKGESLTRNNPLDDGALEHIWRKDYSPSTDWAQGGPIIERERIRIDPRGVWCAAHDSCEWTYYTGETPLIAAMRCYVASKLGDEVEIPEELTQGEAK